MNWIKQAERKALALQRRAYRAGKSAVVAKPVHTVWGHVAHENKTWRAAEREADRRQAVYGGIDRPPTKGAMKRLADGRSDREIARQTYGWGRGAR